MPDCKLALTSLRVSDAPLAAMAAYGLLRVVTEEPEFTRRFDRALLAWDRLNESEWYAVLTVKNETAKDSFDCERELFEGLFKLLERRRKKPWEFWGLKVEKDYSRLKNGIKKDGREEYEALVRQMAESGASLRPVMALGRWGRDGFVLNPILPAGGRIDFFSTYEKVVKYLAGKQQEELKRSLMNGPWKSLDNIGKSGTFRLHRSIVQEEAYIGYETSPNPLPTEAVGEWLAFEALPLYASYLTQGGRGVEFPGVAGRTAFRFPVWQSPVTLPVLCSLLHIVTGKLDSQALRAVGIDGVVEVEQYASSKYRGVDIPVPVA